MLRNSLCQPFSRATASAARVGRALTFLVAFVANGCANQPATPQAELDRKFERMMNGATLVGRSTSLSSDKVSGEEQYIIDKVSKLGGDSWLFEARFRTGGREWPIPIPVQIKWAGDTPVITLTDFAIPGMDSYTARVVLHNGQYAGTWNGKGYGGQIFGKIVPKPE